MQTINCEITKVFDANDNGIGFSLKPDEMTKELQEFVKPKYPENVNATWWFNKKPQPSWVKEGVKIQFDWYKNQKGYLTIDQASLEVISEPKSDEDEFNAAIDEIAEEEALERLAEEEFSKQPEQSNVKKIEVVKSNNPFETKATDMEMAYMACRDKEFFKFFGRDLDALQKLVVTVFLSNR